MSHRREFEIAFVGLKQGIHVYEYRIEDKFFTTYGEQDFKNCLCDVKLSLDKKTNFIQLKFDIVGSIEVVCDKCGNSLNKQLWDEFNLIVKLVDEPDLMNETEEDPDIYYIGHNESQLQVADWIYEFINLSLPMQKICSEEEMGGLQCNNEALERLRKMETEARKDNNNLWKGLEKFKDKD